MPRSVKLVAQLLRGQLTTVVEINVYIYLNMLDCNENHKHVDLDNVKVIDSGYHKNRFKVACVAKIKLFFMDWFYYNLVILIKYCKVPYKNVGKALLFLRNQVFCLKIWKLWPAPTILQFNIFYWNFAHVFYLPLSKKGVWDFFYFI